MLSPDLPSAREALRNREGIKGNNWTSRIGSWQGGQDAPQPIPELAEWAQAHGVDAAVWTALGPRINGQETAPSADQVIAYLRGLTEKTVEVLAIVPKDEAEQWLEKAGEPDEDRSSE